MGILDEAIREHLELKRRHGADDSELRQLEDEAFGQAERPGDGEAAPDPFAEAPTEFIAAPEPGDEPAEETKRELSDIAALQEAPEPEHEAEAEPEPEPEVGAEAEEIEEAPEPAEEEQPAMEHEVVPEPPEPSGPSTEEREVIADQPTEMYDVEGEAEAVEGEVEAVESEEDDDFWNEQRLSDELSQALEAPAEEEPEEAPAEEESEEAGADEEDSEPQEADEDILEDTPEFLEDSEDDQLWFEQKPPKDFDFDD